MKIYEKDYTIPCDIVRNWEKQQQEKREKNKTTRQDFAVEIPHKHVKHYNSLFPNNFLDQSDLKDLQDRFKEELELFFNLIDNKNTIERDILNFIKSKSAYFIIGSLVKQKDFGHHELFIFPEFQLGSQYKVDYLLIGKNSSGYNFLFVELESAYGKITLKDGTYGDAHRKGINQINNWKIWIESNFNNILSTLKNYAKDNTCFPNEFISLDTTRLNFDVICGRRADYKERTYRERRTHEKNNIRILHYDNLIDLATKNIGALTY